MMNIKLKKLTIKNFKIFPFVKLEITTNNLAQGKRTNVL